MEYIILHDYVDDKSTVHSSDGWKPHMLNNSKRLCILDDDGILYLAGRIFQHEDACEEDYDCLVEYAEGFGATQIEVDGEIVIS